MHHIIEQLDAYLAVLHQAREILLNDGRGKPPTKFTRGQSSVRTNSKELQNSGVGRKSSKKRVVSTTPLKTSSSIVSLSEPTATMNSNEGTPVGEIVKRVPAKRRTTVNRLASGRPPQSTNFEPKPTTALSHPIRSNVVVISAEQLRLERERQVKPVVARPHSRGSGATGRLAFEALFGQ